MTRASALQRAAEKLLPRRQELVEAWIATIHEETGAPVEEIRPFAERGAAALLERLSLGQDEQLLRDEELAAYEAARAGTTFLPLAAAMRSFCHAALPLLGAATPDAAELNEALAGLNELQGRRLELLLKAQEDESARRLVEAQEQAARAGERARELAHANDSLRRSEVLSQRRADQVALLVSVIKSVAGILEPERLMQEAAGTIQTRMHYTYAAVVVVDHEGALVGRWSGRPGVSRHSAGRTQGPPRGIIGRALRKRAPQLVGDVASDPDYLPDVEGTRSEMVVPLIDQGETVGAIDFQSEQPNAFDLDDVASGEAIAEFLVVALRNAQAFASLRRPPA